MMRLLAACVLVIASVNLATADLVFDQPQVYDLPTDGEIDDRVVISNGAVVRAIGETTFCNEFVLNDGTFDNNAFQVEWRSEAWVTNGIFLGVGKNQWEDTGSGCDDEARLELTDSEMEQRIELQKGARALIRDAVLEGIQVQENDCNVTLHDVELGKIMEIEEMEDGRVRSHGTDFTSNFGTFGWVRDSDILIEGGTIRGDLLIQYVEVGTNLTFRNVFIETPQILFTKAEAEVRFENCTILTPGILLGNLATPRGVNRVDFDGCNFYPVPGQTALNFLVDVNAALSEVNLCGNYLSGMPVQVNGAPADINACMLLTTPNPQAPAFNPTPTPTPSPTVTPTATPGAPGVYMAGFVQTDIEGKQGGNLEILAVIGPGTDQVEVQLGGTPTGIVLQQVEPALFELAVPLSPLEAQSLLVELSPSGTLPSQGAWPYLTVR